jgi:hypothetical protein
LPDAERSGLHEASISFLPWSALAWVVQFWMTMKLIMMMMTMMTDAQKEQGG